MKNKILSTLVTFIAIGTLITGCGSTLKNEYISIEKYKGLEITELKPVEITDERVDAEIERLQHAHGQSTEVTDRPAEMGDTVILDFNGLKNGEPFEGNYAEGYTIMLGAGPITPGFDEAIVGHEVGEFTIEVTFPANYHMTELAGEPVTFDINLHSITAPGLPELNDDFAKEVSSTATTMDELRAEIKASHVDSSEASVRKELNEAIWEALAENTTIKKLPEDRVEQIKKQLWEHYESAAQAYELSIEAFLNDHMQTDKETLDAELQAEAEKRVLKELSATLIADKEKLVPSDEEYVEKMETAARENGFATAKDFANEHGEDFVKNIVLQEIVANFLLDHATMIPESETTATPTATVTPQQ